MVSNTGEVLEDLGGVTYDSSELVSHESYPDPWSMEEIFKRCPPESDAWIIQGHAADAVIIDSDAWIFKGHTADKEC